MIYKNRFRKIINNINCLVIMNFKKKRKQSKIFRKKIEVSECFINFIKENYEIKLQFKVINKFLEDFDVIKERFISIDSKSSCRFFIKDFKLKLNRKIFLKYKMSDGNEKKIQKNPSITIEFSYATDSLNSDDRDFLSSYINNIK